MAHSGLFDEADTVPLDALDDLIEVDPRIQRDREQAATEVACEAIPAVVTARTTRTLRTRSARRSTGHLHLPGRRRARHAVRPLGLVVGLVAVALALGMVVALL